MDYVTVVAAVWRSGPFVLFCTFSLLLSSISPIYLLRTTIVTRYNMAKQTAPAGDSRVEVINDASDFEPAYECILKCFGHQINDGIWTAMNPGWTTPQGKARNTEDFRQRWQNTKAGGNTSFLKASVPDPDKPGAERIVGVAIWVNASAVPGEGELHEEMNYNELYPGNEKEQRFLKQLLASLHKHRLQLLEEKAKPESEQKSMMVLDLCVTDPDFQRRGIASKLVQWGLDEAKRRGDLEATTEASVMGRHVYKKMGFNSMGEIAFEVDDEFKGRPVPSNLFMRTKP